MLENLKALSNLKEELEAVKRSFADVSVSVARLSVEMASVRETLSQLHQHQSELNHQVSTAVKDFRTDLAAIAPIREEFRSELDHFLAIKKDVQSTILKRFENELSQNLIQHSNELRVTTENYRTIKENIEKLAKLMTSLNSSIETLVGVSKSIKKEDFEMTHTAKQLLSMDRQKVELMRKVDQLQHLIGKMRRQKQ